MDVDFTTVDQKTRYKLLTALVIPRPIAWVTSLDSSGRVNAAPYSFFNVLGNRPAIVAFGPGKKLTGEPKDTLLNVETQKEFVINLVDRDCAEKMHATAAPFPADVSEVEALGLATLPSVSIAPPRLAVSKVHLECSYWGTVEIEENKVVFGIVKRLHAPDGLIDPENHHVEPGAFNGVGRLQGPGWYCTSQDLFDLGRFPRVEDVMGESD